MKLEKANILKFLFISILGTLLHFTYDWSGGNFVVGLFSAQNESTWEHLKLLFFPMLFLTIIQYFFNLDITEDFIQKRTISIISGLAFIVVVFYTTWGISGKLIDWWNISIYFLAVIFSLWLEGKNLGITKRMTTFTSVAILFVLLYGFVIFSINAPAIGIFYDLALHPKG